MTGQQPAEWDEAQWRLSSAKWPVPHEWHDLNVLDDPTRFWREPWPLDVRRDER